MTNKSNELFLKNNNDLKNNVKTKVVREEQGTVPKIRIEAITPHTSRKMIRNHPIDQIIGSKEKGVITRSRINEELCLISQVEPKSLDEATKDSHWMKAMKEELDQILKNETWKLVLRPKDM